MQFGGLGSRIIKSINDNKSNIRLPINKINSINKIMKVKEKLVQQLERAPSESEIIDNADVTANDVKSYLIEGNFESRIDEPLPNSDGLRFEDMLDGGDYEEIENSINYESLRNELKQAMSSLSERERNIITMYYGLDDSVPMTLKEMGQMLGLTNERVRQIMLEAIKKLRAFDKSIRLKEFLKMSF